MFKYLSLQEPFSCSPSGRVIFQAKKNKCQLAILGTLCAYYRPHAIIILKRLNMTHYTEIKT